MKWEVMCSKEQETQGHHRSKQVKSQDPKILAPPIYPPTPCRRPPYPLHRVFSFCFVFVFEGRNGTEGTRLGFLCGLTIMRPWTGALLSWGGIYTDLDIGSANEMIGHVQHRTGNPGTSQEQASEESGPQDTGMEAPKGATIPFSYLGAQLWCLFFCFCF